MTVTLRVVAAAVLIAAAGCSDNNATPRPGVLPPGTAVLSIDGTDVGRTYSVRCETIDWMTRIHTDIAGSGVNAMLSRADALTAEFVRLHDVDGFTGSYERQLQGEATVSMTGPTYHISGAALGFNTSAPARPRTETFAITLSC